MTSCFVYSDSFPELVRYLTERTRDGTALRHRRGGGECNGDGEERPMKSAVIAVASRNVQKKRKGDDAWGAIEANKEADEEDETEKPRLAVKPKPLIGSVENVKPFVESKVPLTAGLHPREPLRDVSAERRRADNAENASKKKVTYKKGRELRYIPVEWREQFDKSDRAEWEKWIRYDAVTIPTKETLDSVDPEELLGVHHLDTNDIL